MINVSDDDDITTATMAVTVKESSA